jgi:hypothetical protein
MSIHQPGSEEGDLRESDQQDDMKHIRNDKGYDALENGLHPIMNIEIRPVLGRTLQDNGFKS